MSAEPIFVTGCAREARALVENTQGREWSNFYFGASTPERRGNRERGVQEPAKDLGMEGNALMIR